MRAFLAFPIPEEVRSRLWQDLEPLRRAGRGVTWVGREQLHITLLFLGELDEAGVRRAKSLLADPALSSAPFAVALGGLGTFPARGSPRVIITEVAEGTEECRAFHGKLAPLAASIAPVERRPYTPHVTVGRVRHPGDRLDLDSYAGPRARFAVERCVLFESILRREGALYREVGAIDFVG